MDAGQRVEFDSPAALLANPDSIFSAMVSKLGADAAASVRAKATGEIQSSTLMDALTDNLCGN